MFRRAAMLLVAVPLLGTVACAAEPAAACRGVAFLASAVGGDWNRLSRYYAKD